MNTKEAYDRLAKCGVVVYQLEHADDLDAMELNGDPISNGHAALMLEAAVLRKWPGWQTSHATSMEAGRPTEEQWTVWRYGDVIGSAPTRLAALVLAAEKASLP